MAWQAHLSWSQAGALLMVILLLISIACIALDIYLTERKRRRLNQYRGVTSPAVSRAWLRALRRGEK